MKFKVETGQIKTRELIECETSLIGTINLMSRFMVDEAGNPIPEKEARESLLDLDIDEQMKVQEQFVAGIIPNLKGRRS